MRKIERLATLINAYQNCVAKDNQEWKLKHLEALRTFERNSLPSGLGFDCGTQIALEECKDNFVVFNTQFHHMNADGYYDGWTSHKVVIKPDFISGLDIRISGRDRNDIKDLIHETFYHLLAMEDTNGQ